MSKLTAFDKGMNRITVEIDPMGDRHCVVAGEEIDLHNTAGCDPELERWISDALDDLYDLPIYEDGTIHTGKTAHVWAWQDAVPVSD